MPFPTLKRVQSAFIKAGATIVAHGTNNGFKATKGANTVIFYHQEGFPDRSVRSVSLMFSPSPHTDIMTDCFCDSYHHNIKSAVYALNES